MIPAMIPATNESHEALPDLPARRDGDIEVRPMDDELMVIDLEDDRVHFLNPGMAAIWRLCDGRHTADQIREALSRHFDCSAVEDLEQSVEQSLRTLSRLGLLRSARPRPMLA